MANGNYDVLMLLHEKALNKALAMAFYNGLFDISGTYELESSLPDSMKPFTSFGYEILLDNEPFVDLIAEDYLQIRFTAILNLTLLTGIKLKFKIAFQAKSYILFDLSQKKLKFKLDEASIQKISIQNQYQVNSKFLGKLNYILQEIISKYFKNTIREIDIPLALYGLTLPMMPEGDACQLPISKIDIKIVNNKFLAIGIGLFQNTGSFTGLTDMLGNKDCYISIKGQTVANILDFWWKNTTFSKSQTFEKNVEIGFATPLASGIDKVTRIATLGFVQTETDYEDMVLNFGGTIHIDEQPLVALKQNDQVEISQLDFVADIYANMLADVKKQIALDTSSFIPDHITPWQDDINLKNIDKNKKLLELKNKFTLQVIKAQGQLKVNDQNNLAIKITEADFKILFDKKGSTFSDNTWNKLMDFLKERVLEKIPEIIVSPSLVLSGINIFGFSLRLSDSYLNIENDEIEFSTNLIINELNSNTVVVPNYIANKETKVVHHLSCKHCADIAPENRIGYYVMYEILASGYKTCRQCLGNYALK